MIDMDAYFDAKTEWQREHGKVATRVYVSPLTAARIANSANERGEIPVSLPNRCIGVSVCECDWYSDPEMTGDGFRFEA